MKIPPQLLFYWQRYRRPILFCAILLVILLAGIIFRLLTPEEGPQIQPPSYPPITPKAGFNSPRTVNLNLLPITSIPTSIPSYTFEFADFENHRQIATALGFSGSARAIQSITAYSNNLFLLTLDPINKTLYYSYESDSILDVQGEFKSIDELLADTVLKLKALNIYDQSTNFVLASSNFARLDGEYLLPSLTTDAQVVQLILNPTVESRAIYLQQPLIEATYNRQNTLIKLTILHPFAKQISDEVTYLYSFEQIRAFRPEDFFPLYITPANVQQVLSRPTGLPEITPQQLQVGYFLDLEGKRLQPIFTFSGSATINQSYIFATLAYPTAN